ncbi:MAG: hypothetical protein FWG98_12485 [Candidatus Cloacimonetes bacterium]|nr:hypothetical protein [Candidatus Cloacimonadota bacterium]
MNKLIFLFMIFLSLLSVGCVSKVTLYNNTSAHINQIEFTSSNIYTRKDVNLPINSEILFELNAYETIYRFNAWDIHRRRYVKEWTNIKENKVITFTISDRDPLLTINNLSGYSINLVEPFIAQILNQNNTSQSIPKSSSVQIKYTIDGIQFSKNVILNDDVTIATIEPHLKLKVINRTGHPISVTSPFRANLNDNAEYDAQVASRGTSTIVYTINNMSFSQEVVVNNDTIISLTDAPKSITITNRTGFPISLTTPLRQTIVNGETSNKYVINNRNATTQTIQYNSGTYTYTKEITLSSYNTDVVLNENDRPPIITITNNTGNVINSMNIRNNGNINWGNNLFTLLQVDDGANQGSLTNRENSRLWIGDIRTDRLDYREGKIDIRFDDVNGAAYVKLDIKITQDMTLSFTQRDKP